MIKLPFNLNLSKEKPQTILFIALASVLILVIYFYFMLLPQIGWVTDILGKTGKLMSDVKSAELLISKKEIFKNDIGSYRGKVESYEKRLPAEQEIPSILENLSNMAKGSNVKILGIAPVQVSAKEAAAKNLGKIYKEIPILINAKSGYHELGIFLSNLENANRFMKVVDIEVKSSKASPKKHDIELIVCTYVLLGGR